jgi:hypothetical protein
VTSHRLKLLAISDTHLGEETSLLSFPRGIQHVWTTLADDPDFWRPVFPDFVPDFEGGKKVEVEELVLVGDIPDRTLSSTSQISAHTHAFAMMLGSALDIEKAVYVPGNHDHTLWTSLAEANRSSGDGSSGITNPGGELLVEGGVCSDEAAEEILSILFAYPSRLGLVDDQQAARIRLRDRQPGVRQGDRHEDLRLRPRDALQA